MGNTVHDHDALIRQGSSRACEGGEGPQRAARPRGVSCWVLRVQADRVREILADSIEYYGLIVSAADVYRHHRRSDAELCIVDSAEEWQANAAVSVIRH